MCIHISRISLEHPKPNTEDKSDYFLLMRCRLTSRICRAVVYRHGMRNRSRRMDWTSSPKEPQRNTHSQYDQQHSHVNANSNAQLAEAPLNRSTKSTDRLISQTRLSRTHLINIELRSRGFVGEARRRGGRILARKHAQNAVSLL